MSDLLTSLADALGTPAELISRSAAARAAANGTTTDDVLSAWSGGAPIAAATSRTSVPEADDGGRSSIPEADDGGRSSIPEADDGGTAEPVAEQPTAPPGGKVPDPVAELQPAAKPTTVLERMPAPVEIVEPLQPVELAYRLRTAGRVGVWTGAVLGLFAFVAASAWWSQSATVAGDEQLRPVLVANASTVVIGIALASFVFGALVASLARAAASWTDPAMALSSRKSSTAWIGAFVGLALGFGAGALLANGYGTPIEGAEGLVELPVLTTLAVMLIGGALLGWITTLATQFFGVPVAVDDADTEEVNAVKARLGNAIGIPIAGLILLLALVLPVAWALIRSNHLTAGGAAIIAIVASSGILGFAALAGSKPNVRISKGEFLVALAGIGIVILLVFAVISNVGGDDHSDGDAEAVVHQVVL